MKNVLKLCLMTALFFMAISCSQNINSSFSDGKESLEFSFRANEELVGSELEVTVEEYGTILETKKENITKDSTVVNIVFNNLSLGSDVVVKAKLKKGSAVLYEGSESVFISSKDNKVSLELTAAGIELCITPRQLNIIPEIEGASFNVTVNGKKYPSVEVKSGTPLIADIGVFPIGTKLDISATIEKEGNLFYEVENFKHEVKDSDNIQIDLDPFGGYFLWGKLMSEQGPSSVYEIKQSKAIDGGESMLNPSPERSKKVIDFSFGEDGSVWAICGYNGDILNIHKFAKKEPVTYKIDSATSSAILGMNAIAASDGGAYVSSTVQGNQIFFIREADAGTFSTQIFNILGISESNSLREIAVSGNTIALVYEQTEGDDSVSSSKIYKGVLDTSKSSITVDPTAIFDSIAYPLFSDGKYAINDLQIVGNRLYALVIDTVKGGVVRESGYQGRNSRGALVEIDLKDGSTNVTGMLKKTISAELANGGPDEGLFMIQESDKATYDTCFMGPRKFIAIKPKKLVIADAGALWSADIEGNKKTKQRVVTVNLEDKVMSGTDLAMDGYFGGSLTSSTYTYYRVER